MGGWAIVTGEYPPQPGGVADHTASLAHALQGGGERVRVYAPHLRGVDAGSRAETEVPVQRLPDCFGARGRRVLGQVLDADQPSRVLVQYVPHAYGYKGMNLPFAAWLNRLGRRHEVWTLFHEVAFPIGRGEPLRHNVLGAVTRFMARQVARGSQRVFVTIPAWGEMLRPMLRPGHTVEWLPVPTNLPTDVSAEAVARVRARIEKSRDGAAVQIVGHFGTYGEHVAGLLSEIVGPLLLADRRRVGLLIGRGGETFAQSAVARHPSLADRLIATGGLPAEEAAAHVAACDVLVQPYADGVTSRRSTVMAGLALGVPVVTNAGPLSEPMWGPSGAVRLLPDPAADGYVDAVGQLLDSPAAREELGGRARALYADRFSIEHTVRVLRSELRAHCGG